MLIIHNKLDFAPQITYTFEVLLSQMGLRYELLAWPCEELTQAHIYEQPVILYGDETLNDIPARRKLHIHCSDFFGLNYLTANSMPALPLDWVQVDEKRLPVLYNAESALTGPILLSTTDGDAIATRSQGEAGLLIQTNLDLVAGAFFMLSRYEEMLSRERDMFDRFPFRASLAFKEGFWRTPIVNLYARLLEEWISILTDSKLEPSPTHYPNGQTFGLCLTHDVDSVKKFTPIGLLKTIAKVMLGRQNRQAWRQIGDYLGKGQDPFWNFAQIVDLEQEYGFQSIFFLAANHQHKYDPPYGDDVHQIGHLCQTLLALGAEVGLHGSFTSYSDAEILREELVALSQHAPVSGGRQHYLRLDTQHTFLAMEQIGLLYDCTLGFSGELGFRSGYAGPHYAFNLNQNRFLKVLEIPLAIMDRSLWSLYGQGSSTEATWEQMLQILEPVREYNGCVSVLWHNAFFDEAAYPGYADLYRRLLEWLVENNGWGASGRQVYDWFINHRIERIE